jgi:PII-like signaling protein
MMKRITLLAAIAASVFMLVSASVWEGAAGIGEDLPENGFYLSTNSFPVNTVVEVVNLENNRSVSLIVASSLGNSGLLAELSKDAADYIGLKDISRIRMREKDDQVGYSAPGERIFFSGDPNYGTGGNSKELIEGIDAYDWAMIPAETRPPEDLRLPNPDDFIHSITIPPVTSPPVSVSSATPRFSAPLIQSFDRGSYYVQIGAYRTTQTVESEILKVDKNLPVAVMRIESEDGPIYRVLIGPLNLGESGPVLQRYKAIYKDALLRVGN